MKSIYSFCLLVYMIILYTHNPIQAKEKYNIKIFDKSGLGFSIAPSMSFNRIKTKPRRDTNFSSSSFSMKFIVGPHYDIVLTDKYCLRLGLLYAWTKAAIQYKKEKKNEQYDLQYIQLPILIKIHLLSVSNINLFFLSGPQLSILTDQEYTFKNPWITKFNFWDIGIVFGIYGEYIIKDKLTLIAGINYYHGLCNIVNKHKNFQALISKLILKNNLLSINMGVKF